MLEISRRAAGFAIDLSLVELLVGQHLLNLVPMLGREVTFRQHADLFTCRLRVDVGIRPLQRLGLRAMCFRAARECGSIAHVGLRNA